jgi:hypothetical protein
MPQLVTLAFLLLSALAFAQDTNFTTGPQYLMNYGSPLLFHSIATPSLSLSTPPAASPNASPEQGSGEPRTPAFGGEPSQAAIDRIYWGVPTVKTMATIPERYSEIVLTSQAPANVPPSILDTGVTSMADANVASGTSSLADIARAAKANRRQPMRVFTNDDIGRLHSQ